MRSNLLGRWAGLGVVALAVLRPVAAQERLPAPDAAKTAPETKPLLGAEHAAENEHASSAEHPAGGECEAPEHGHCFLQADYLLMQPRRRALDFAISDPNHDGLPQGSVESVRWDAHSGFRVGGGYHLPDNGWEVGLYYTYLYASNQRLVDAPTGGTLYPTLTHPGLVTSVDSAFGTAKLEYQVLDLEVGRRFESGESLSFWLGGGPRFGWIKQALRVQYNGQAAFMDQVSSPVDFEGAGIRVGGEGQWNVGWGMGLYARAFGSLVAGDFRTAVVETNNNGAALLVQTTDRFHKVVPVSELGIGLSWKSENVRVRLGYEMTNWYGLVDSPDIVNDTANKLGRRVSDLSLDGLRFGVEVDY